MFIIVAVVQLTTDKEESFAKANFKKNPTRSSEIPANFPKEDFF